MEIDLAGNILIKNKPRCIISTYPQSFPNFYIFAAIAGCVKQIRHFLFLINGYISCSTAV